jgi:hypothetical protein
MTEIDANSALELVDQVFQRQNAGSLSRIADPIETEQLSHHSDTVGQRRITIFLTQILG